MKWKMRLNIIKRGESNEKGMALSYRIFKFKWNIWMLLQGEDKQKKSQEKKIELKSF